MFSFETVIRLQHTDAAGVMFFPRIFELAHLAYEALLEEIGQPIPADMAASPYVIPIVRTEADYRAALRLNDRVRIEVGVEALRGRSFTLAYAVLRDGDVTGTVKTVHVVVSNKTGKAMTMPEGLKEGLAAHRTG